MGNIKVKSIPSTFKGILGFDGKRFFITRWIKR